MPEIALAIRQSTAPKVIPDRSDAPHTLSTYDVYRVSNLHLVCIRSCLVNFWNYPFADVIHETSSPLLLPFHDGSRP